LKRKLRKRLQKKLLPGNYFYKATKKLRKTGAFSFLNETYGKIEAVTPQEFVSRLDGANPAETIYFAVANGKAAGNKKIADRAKAMIGKRRQYNVLLDNCHQFTCGCLSGDFENPCNYFTLVQAEIISRFGIFSWKEWDY
jgi:hypothetical protein